MLEDRIISLEEKYSHQDELVNQLNSIVAQQETMIEGLAFELKSLREAFQQTSNGNTNGPSLMDEVPPHY